MMMTLMTQRRPMIPATMFLMLVVADMMILSLNAFITTPTSPRVTKSIDTISSFHSINFSSTRRRHRSQSLSSLNSSFRRRRDDSDSFPSDQREEYSIQRQRERRRLDGGGRGFRQQQQNGSPGGRRRHQDRNNNRSSSSADFIQLDPERRKWLVQATNNLLGAEVGSLLVMGKWHELVSMFQAWSKYVKIDGDAPWIMERILKRLLDERRAGKEERKQRESSSVSPSSSTLDSLDDVVDINMYNQVLDAWTCAALFKTQRSRIIEKSGGSSGLRRNDGRENSRTTTKSSATTTSGEVYASQRAREILVLLQETYEAEGDKKLRPNMESFRLVFHVVLRIEGVHMARRVLAWMEYLYKQRRNKNARPSRGQYIRLLDAYARSRHENAGQLAEGFLRHMNITAGMPPDTLCYNMAIKAWVQSCKSGGSSSNKAGLQRQDRGREAAEHADQILSEMDAPKDIVTYASVISAWATSGMRSHAVARAEELLRNIEDDPLLEPNTVVLNTVMSTWTKSRNPAAVNRTAELLSWMEQQEQQHQSIGENSTAAVAAVPDLISYNTHLHALSLHTSPRRPEYAQRAQDLLDTLQTRYENGEIEFKPNLFTYNLVIDAWSKLCTSPLEQQQLQSDGRSSKGTNAAHRAVQVLRRLIQDPNTPNPDAFSFNQVILALSKSSHKLDGAAKLAEELLLYMEEGYKLKIHRQAKPDVIGYTSVISAWAKSGADDAAERAERLFNHMKEQYKSGEFPQLKPTRVVYNSLIDCWAKSGKGTLAARKAEALLQEMKELCEAGDGDDRLAPNSVTYNAVLNSWAQSGTRCCGNKAESYLQRMWELYDGGNGHVRPNDKSFNTVINAISKSQNKAKAQKALRLLRKMDRLYRSGYKDARPNEVTYTSVLNSCAFPAVLADPRTRRKALDTAIFTLEELQASRYGQPNEITYGTFIKACANLLDGEGDEALKRMVIEKAFQQCCRDGQVGEMVLAHLRDAAPADLYEELLGRALVSSDDDRAATATAGTTTARSAREITIHDLPPEWRCNVRDFDGGSTWGRERSFERRSKELDQWEKVPERAAEKSVGLTP